MALELWSTVHQSVEMYTVCSFQVIFLNKVRSKSALSGFIHKLFPGTGCSSGVRV